MPATQRPRGAGLAALAIGIGMLGACSGTREEAPERLIPSPRVYESDIPLPDGFRIEERAMEDHSTGQARTYLRHMYVGSADKFAVRAFYREQMPLSRWSLISDSAIKGEFSMRFAKGAESCVVHIGDEAKGFGRRTTIQVMISPEKRGAAPPGAKNQR